MPSKSKAELQRLIELAAQLGFWDDVKHWKRELKKLENEGASNV